jgi:CDP-glucose 4,6-dehydratase
LAERLLEQTDGIRGQAFNFSNELQVTVTELVSMIVEKMESTLIPDVRNEVSNEIRLQCLTAERAREQLGWRPLFTLEEGLTRTISWYRDFFKDSI